jgi:oligopeptidase A
MPLQNPLLQYRDLPQFDKITPADAQPAIDHIIAEAETAFIDMEANILSSWEGCMLPLRNLAEPLDFAWGIISHLHSVMNTPDWRAAHDSLQPKVIEFSLRLSQSEPIYRALESIQGSAEWTTLGEAKQRIIESAIRSAKLAGVGLPDAKRERFNTLKRELANLSTQFSNNLLDATKAFSLELTAPDDVEGLPQPLLTAASECAKQRGHKDSTPTAGPWVITLEMPLFGPFMQYCERRDHRETLYRAFLSRASSGETDNTPLIEDILSRRQEVASLLGYATHAEVSLAQKMAENVDAVDRLIERLRTVAHPVAIQELEALQQFAAEHGQTEAIMNWDVGYWSEQMKEALYGFNAEDLRPYFQFPRVLDGLFTLAQQLFGITITAADDTTSVWHEDVRYFRVDNEQGTQIASFYLDPYSRPETKRGGAWMDSVRPRYKRPDGSLTLPAAYLVCNQTLPADGNPSLMTFDEVTTLFHEFGHGLQHILTTVDEPEAAGVNNVEWDAVELPSQFMENWCYHKSTIMTMSCHIDSGEVLPEDLYDKVCKARTFRAASFTLRQLLFSALDIELHHRYSPGGTKTAETIKRDIGKAYTLLPFIESDRFLCGFAHIFAGGYAAGYYSYKWAEVLSADAFEAFVEAGVDAPEQTALLGRNFRNTVLARGGAQHPMEVFKAFRGRTPDPDALLRHDGLLSDAHKST